MTDIRVENEIKLYAENGPFEYDGIMSERPMALLQSALTSAGIEYGDYKVRKFTDEYFTDTGDTFDAQGIILRFRDEGPSGKVTIKKPYVRNGLGLSRREIETEIFKNSQFDKYSAVKDHAQHYLARTDIAPVPKVIDNVIRCECYITSDIRRYKMSFDRVVYTDPASGKKTVPSYEIEIESLDQAIKDDPNMIRLIDIISDRYLFEEVRVSKYARGRAWIKSLAL